jgi:glycogen(starch) synthase
MRILVVTNLYPPQELGGYGRAMADFVWGLQQRGHQVQVVCSDAPYLGPGGVGPSGEPVDRRLQLKGSFERGVQHLTDPAARSAVDQANASLLRTWLQSGGWDGVLLGNIDLLGAEVLPALLELRIPVLHHVGFVAPPFAPEQYPKESHYRLLAASRAVRQSLVTAGLPVAEAPVVYPGARVELFGPAATRRALPPPPDGTYRRPLRVCFAGLLMSSKGPHSVLEALVHLRDAGVPVQLTLAGGRFQLDYVRQLQTFVKQHELSEQVLWLGQLRREQLARMFALQHVAVFPSLYPEAFGIVAAEGMASGLALVSSGVGGAAELFEPSVSGLSFPPGDAGQLANQLSLLARSPQFLLQLQQAGQQRVKSQFGVMTAAHQLERLWRDGA